MATTAEQLKKQFNVSGSNLANIDKIAAIGPVKMPGSTIDSNAAKMPGITTDNNAVTMPGGLETPKTTPVEPKIINREALGANIQETLKKEGIGLKTANLDFINAVAQFKLGRDATKDELAAGGEFGLAGATVKDVLGRFGATDLAPSFGIGIDEVTEKQRTGAMEEILGRNLTPSETTQLLKERGFSESEINKALETQRQTSGTVVEDKPKTLQERMDEHAATIGGIKEDKAAEVGLSEKEQTERNLKAELDQMMSDMEFEKIFDLEAENLRKDLFEEGQEGITARARKGAVTQSVVNRELNKRITGFNKETSQRNREDMLKQATDIYKYNTKVNQFNLAKGDADAAREDVKEASDNFYEYRKIAIEDMAREQDLAADETASLQQRNNDMWEKESAGYVNIEKGNEQAMIEQYGEDRIYTDAYGDSWVRPEEGVGTLEALNIQSKKLDIKKKIQDLNAEPTISPATITQVDKISSSFDSSPIVKNFVEVQNKKLSIDDIVENGVGGPADLALVFEFMKALDPTSVVRESEYESAAKSGNIFSGIFAKFNGYLKEEGGFLPETVKEEFKRLSGSKFDIIKGQYTNLRKEKSRLIDRKTGDVDGSEYLVQYDFDTSQPQTFDDYYNSLNDEEADSVDALQTEMNISDDDMWEFIQEEEGFSKVGADTNLGSNIVLNSRLAKVNNNPGNLRLAGQEGATQGEGGFARFDTPEQGVNALKNDIQAKITGNSPATRAKLGRDAETLREVISIYAPKEDNNDPNSYSNFVAKELGISPDEPVSNLINRINDLTRAFALKESSSTIS